MPSVTTVSLTHLNVQALARYLALPASLRACLDFWIDHAVQPATTYRELNKVTFEFWESHRRHLYVTNEAFNGALLAHGYDALPYPDMDVDRPARFNATFTPAVKRRLRRGDPTPWDAEFDTLVAHITGDDERAAHAAMGLKW